MKIKLSRTELIFFKLKLHTYFDKETAYMFVFLYKNILFKNIEAHSKKVENIQEYAEARLDIKPSFSHQLVKIANK